MNSLLSPALTCETDTLRSPVTVSVVERENIYHVVVLLAAVQLIWQRICFLGEVLAFTLIHVLFKHSYIISQKLRRKVWNYFPLFI